MSSTDGDCWIRAVGFNALVAAVGNAITFRRGRDLSAWLGLVPRQRSTGGKAKLLGISKRGNEYLRRMFLYGARSVVLQIERNRSALGLWLTELSARAHRNISVVALANKMARTAWALLSMGIPWFARGHATMLAKAGSCLAYVKAPSKGRQSEHTMSVHGVLQVHIKQIRAEKGPATFSSLVQLGALGLDAFVDPFGDILCDGMSEIETLLVPALTLL